MSRAVKGSLSRSHDKPWHTPACPVQRCHRGDFRDSASRCWYPVASDAREDQWHAKFERKHGWGPHRRACKVDNPVCKSVCAPHRVFHVSAAPNAIARTSPRSSPSPTFFAHPGTRAPGHPTTDDLANNPPCSSRLASTDRISPASAWRPGGPARPIPHLPSSRGYLLDPKDVPPRAEHYLRARFCSATHAFNHPTWIHPSPVKSGGPSEGPDDD